MVREVDEHGQTLDAGRLKGALSFPVQSGFCFAAVGPGCPATGLCFSVSLSASNTPG